MNRPFARALRNCVKDVAAFAAMGVFLYAAGLWLCFGSAS